MKNLNILILFLLVALNIQAQDNAYMLLSKKVDANTYLFINNSDRNWYTIELKTDTLFVVKDNLYFVNDKTMQIISLAFDNQRPTGTRGNMKAEKQALQGHRKWAFDYQKKQIGKKVKSKEAFFYNKAGKPFLIWWYESPKEQKEKGHDLEVVVEKFNSETPDSSFVELKSTHQLFLDFITHGDNCVSISVPVLENENLQNEINKLKSMAESLNVYGGDIDLGILSERIENPDYIFRDSQNLIEIEIPSWLNVCKSPYKRVFSASFPEKDNITNAVAVMWELKSDSVTFNDFKNSLIAKDIDENSMKVLSREESKERYFFTKRNGWFHGQNVFIEGEDVYCYINFIATETTYNYNLERFYELVDKIKIE